MKQFYLLTFALASAFMAKAQTFTVAQNTTGMTQEIYGQGFTPSIQGSGTGNVGTATLVGLYEFSFMLDAAKTPDILYIYEVLPSGKDVLLDGTGGTLVGQSTSKTEERFWFTNYKFNGLALDKNKMYYALFRELVNCEAGGGGYAGGDIYRSSTDNTINTTVYADARFKASFAPPVITSVTKHDVSSLLVHPSLTNGDISIRSEISTVIDVYSLTGVKVKTIKVDCGQNLKSIADLSNGIYLLQSEGKIISKVVKK